MLNKVVDIKGYGLGPYNRVPGVITTEGRNVNLEMVKAGLAEVYRGEEEINNSSNLMCEIEVLMKKTKIILSVLLLLLTTFGMTSCSELHSEFDPHKWRYQPFRDMPPSWENDMGRPGPEYGGEDMFGDTW